MSFIKTVIITDSTCDLRKDVQLRLDVEVVPLTVSFNNINYKDGFGRLLKRIFYSQLRAGRINPMTSQPSPDEFLKIFQKSKEQGNEVIYIGISSRSSGTLQAAKVARDLCDYENIHIVDSLNLSHGMEVLVRIACRLRERGENAKTIVEEIRKVVPKVRFITYVDNLKYLVRGGRVKGYTSYDDGKLNMKTLVEMTNGRFTPVAIARGKIGAFEKIHEIMRSHSVDEMLPVVLTHADNREDMRLFERFLKSRGMIYNYNYSEIGGVIGAHMGPGTVGIAYIEK